ncbi:mycothiol synthase [Cryobacterium sp. SO2]|uniref:mycothiol synthase n=1 Tax=Cryobacterium sp. SO2 TaxID=1897060 RepID=UPI00223E6C71|nr:mycothiol synthase [Cryobacterium sp. SO2]WEO76630.1 mycothiol synthase [Cryobacterium sp. SO2]
MSFTLSAPDLADAAFAARFHDVADASAHTDGYRPFNEQAMLDARSGRRSPQLLLEGEDAVGALILGQGEIDLVVHPRYRRKGHATAALRRLFEDEGGMSGDLTAWAHGDHPAARALADRFGFSAERTLLQLERPLSDADAATSPVLPAGIGIVSFRPADAAEWVRLNALVFATHPEQGAITESDLAARMAEPWFDADDLLLARENSTAAAPGRILGYNWLKIEPGATLGEIYVLGVHPDAAGAGLGRALMLAGLARLRERGCTAVELYVEAESTTPVRLYRSLGFGDRTVDVQYHRGPR